MICGSCHRPVATGAQYCVACGAKVTEPAVVGAQAHLTERKFVTVVFMDMVGSLGVIRDKDPEDAHEMLSTALDVMTEAVHAHGGVVIDRMGDGIMAIFGAPAAQEDHAVRACRAALHSHARVARTLARGIELRVGMDSGEVAVGTALNDFAMDYTATGAVVHIASRLQGVAPPNATVMTARTAALVRDVMSIEPMGHSLVKGLAEPVDLHRLVGAHGTGQQSPQRVHRPFVGRAAALAELGEALGRAIEGRGYVLGISGEAGIGKTTLIERFAHRQRRSVTLIRGMVEHHTGVAPFRPLADVLIQLLGLTDVAPPQRRPAVVQELEALGLDPRTHEPPLLDLLELDGLPPAWPGLAPLVRHNQIRTAVVEVLLAASRRRALVIVLDDLQRADSATIDLVGQLINAIAGHRLLVIVAFRPELAPRWDEGDSYRALRLDRLSDDDTRALVAALLGTAAPPQVERRLVGWSKGNPLFLCESVRAMLEAGALADAEAAATMAVPPSIGSVIAARIDRLAASAKRVLLAGSVVGEQFARHILASVTGLDDAELTVELDALIAAGFVRLLEPASGSYAFDHGLFQEVAYATLLRRQRRDLHQAAFRALRRDVPNAGPQTIEALARHAVGGELWRDAVPLCREAGHRAAQRYSNREAALHLENAIAALSHADTDGAQLRDAIELRLELRSSSIPLLRLDRIGNLLAEASRMAEQLGDLALRARVAAYMAGYAYLTRNPTRCIELCRDARRLAARAPDPTLRIAPTLYLAQAQYGLGEYRRVVAGLEKDVSLRDASLSGPATGLPLRPMHMRRYWLAIAMAELGRFDEALALAREMLAQVDARQPFELLYALTAQGFILMLRGELKAALQSSAAALETAEHNDVTFIVPVIASQVGYLLAGQGHAGDGMAMARRAVRKAEDIGIYAGRSRWCARLAEACLAAGNATEARLHAQTALRVAEDGGERGYLCSALRLQAKLKVADADLDGAADDLKRATNVAHALRLGPALAKCQFDTGALAHCGGRLNEARRAFGVAGRAFARYGMAAGAARAEQAGSHLDARSAAPKAEEFFGSAE